MPAANTTDYVSVGSVIYPGIKQIVSASYSRSHGITPDICQIEMAPQTLDPKDKDYVPIEPDGYLIFRFDTAKISTDGNGITSTTNKRVEIVMQSCRPDKASVRRSASSENWTIPVYDRRWKWKFGSFSGHWNVKKNGVIEKRKEKTARELANLCLEAMGEKKYETKALDELEKGKDLPYRKKVRPEVHWDRIPPAQALSELVTSLGYRVCLDWNDIVRIEKYGEGELLPTDDLMSGGFDADLPEVPDSVTVLGGISYHEALWELEPVGLDIDGEWRPINHLSYTPSEKYEWLLSDPPNFPGIEQKYDEVKDNKKPKDPIIEHRKQQLKLAQETVFRCYRLKYPAGTKESEVLRKKYDELGRKVAKEVDKGIRRGDKKSFDKLMDDYEEAGRELFYKAGPILPGPKVTNPKTGKKEDYKLALLEQVLPCFETRAGLAIDPITGSLKRKDTIVLGERYSDTRGYNTELNVYFRRDEYSIIPEQGIIKFNNPVYKLGTAKVPVVNGSRKTEKRSMYVPASLGVLIAVPLKSVVGEPARYEYHYEVPKEYRTKPAKLPSGLQSNPRKLPGGTDTKIVVNNQIVQAYEAVYEFNKSKITGEVLVRQKEVKDNAKSEDFEKLALADVDVTLLRLTTGDAGSGIYAGLKRIDLDGAIQQVAIRLTTQGGMTTTVARNREVNIYVPNFDERQRSQDLKEMIRKHRQTVDKTEKVNPKGD
ncbi:hypothetical protein Pan241w_11150 [Gimesia alba]|uniref:Uncharacterized protein n=1 Tax=Gimesia alba TaxID=2527973 RepID=A0A517RAZ5_9PLAN|nr:hypothetical protein [Gimesia alba]QDT41056.1 hypothetical protein Pan241w_11150 [Gimesia alba]